VLAIRLPVYLLPDIFGSMAFAPIEAVKDGVKALLARLKTAPQADATVYLSVVTFDSVANQVIPLMGADEFSVDQMSMMINWTTDSGSNRGPCESTCMGEALKLLLDCYDRELIKITSATQKGDYKPLVLLLTDGSPTVELEKVADEIGASHE
jgi:uncharacterized protein YegL